VLSQTSMEAMKQKLDTLSEIMSTSITHHRHCQDLILAKLNIAVPVEGSKAEGGAVGVVEGTGAGGEG
jgi:hypothetical protein